MYVARWQVVAARGGRRIFSERIFFEEVPGQNKNIMTESGYKI